MWKTIKTWLLDHEKLMIPVYALAIVLIFMFPQYLYQIPLTLFFLYKIFTIATDKSTNSTVKEIRAILGDKAIVVPPVTPPTKPLA